MSRVLVESAADEDEILEDRVIRIMEAKKMLPHASYFAFTATPKNKTLEMFGEPYGEGRETEHRPFAATRCSRRSRRASSETWSVQRQRLV